TQVGRRRYIPEINSPNFMVANAAERMAINMPIQGLAADIMKLATIAAEKLVEKYPARARMILQVHDELIFEVREDVAEEFSARIKDVMEKVYELKIPLIVDVKVGDNWGSI
ncbi:MAG: DNA polymerase, partial [Patescibacteria group bacterium]